MIHPFIVLYGNSEPDKTSNKHLLIIVVVQQLWASLVAQMVKNLPAMWEIPFDSWVGKIPQRRMGQPTPVFLPGESPWTKEPGGLQWDHKESDTTE